MVFDYIYPIIQGISTAIVLVRVEMGLTYDVDSNTAIHFAASETTKDDSHDTTLSRLP